MAGRDANEGQAHGHATRPAIADHIRLSGATPKPGATHERTAVDGPAYRRGRRRRANATATRPRPIDIAFAHPAKAISPPPARTRSPISDIEATDTPRAKTPGRPQPIADDVIPEKAP